ncbi:hypothetical protein CIP106467_4139 [Citrobacter europaeus]|nr:hypothetical protein CIP106467_4139 [Citrobacter europaeus]
MKKVCREERSTATTPLACASAAPLIDNLPDLVTARWWR